MDVTHDRLVEILRIRYDHYSARAVLGESLEKAQLAQKAAYQPVEVEKLAEQVAARRDRTEQVAAYLRAEIRSASPAAAPPSPAAAPPPSAAPPAKPPEKPAAKPAAAPAGKAKA